MISEKGFKDCTEIVENHNLIYMYISSKSRILQHARSAGITLSIT
jgi:hypothetical protein